MSAWQQLTWTNTLGDVQSSNRATSMGKSNSSHRERKLPINAWQQLEKLGNVRCQCFCLGKTKHLEKHQRTVQGALHVEEVSPELKQTLTLPLMCQAPNQLI